MVKNSSKWKKEQITGDSYSNKVFFMKQEELAAVTDT